MLPRPGMPKKLEYPSLQPVRPFVYRTMADGHVRHLSRTMADGPVRPLSRSRSENARWRPGCSRTPALRYVGVDLGSPTDRQTAGRAQNAQTCYASCYASQRRRRGHMPTTASQTGPPCRRGRVRAGSILHRDIYTNGGREKGKKIGGAAVCRGLSSPAVGISLSREVADGESHQSAGARKQHRQLRGPVGIGTREWGRNVKTDL